MLSIEILESLKQSVLFELAPDSVLEKVAGIVHRKSIKTDEKLIEKGEMGDSMYIVCNGKVKVHDGDLLLNYLGKGNVFGEMAALDNEFRTASITAVEDTELIQLNHDDLFNLIGREPEVARALIHFLCQRGKNIYGDITDRSFKLRTLEREFEIGRDIQAGFLPESIPDIPAWDMAAYFQAAKEVAGDFYDVFEVKHQNKIGLVIGDVCGKGVGAALFMTLFRSLLRASTLAGDFMGWKDAPETDTGSSIQNAHQILLDAMALTNNYIAQTHEKACMFATIFIGLLDPVKGTLAYVNAGHESPVILNPSGEVKELLEPTGTAAGLFAGTEFTVSETKLEPGDSFIGFTDGVTEAVNPKNQQFSTKRLLDLIINNNGTSQECLEEVVQSLKEFTEDVEQFDDITLLKVKRKCEAQSKMCFNPSPEHAVIG